MNNSIQTYEDLLAEQVRLKERLHVQGLEIKHDLAEIKDELNPIFIGMSFLRKITRPENRNYLLLKAGSAIALNFLVKKLVSKNIITRMLVPLLFNNASSYLFKKLVKAVAK